MESKEPTPASSSPITLGYGRDGLRVDLPNSVDVTLICKAPSAVPADQGALIDAALNNPVGPGRPASTAAADATASTAADDVAAADTAASTAAAAATAATAADDAPPWSVEACARNKSTACILICDITRPVPNGLFLRRIIERLVAVGVPFSGITVLVATGLHRPNLGAGKKRERERESTREDQESGDLFRAKSLSCPACVATHAHRVRRLRSLVELEQSY